MSRTWILLGMMGSGKSTLGKALAGATGRDFQDTDAILQSKLGHSIPRLFSLYGEDTFRDHETAVLRELQPGHCVLATGGGIVLREENWEEMRRLGSTLYLRVPLETLKERLVRSKRRRPLLAHEDWECRLETLMALREELYLKADLTVSLGGCELDDAVEATRRLLESAAGETP